MFKPFVCPHCHSVGTAKPHYKGSFYVEVLLWVCFIIPGAFYSLWRQSTMQHVCGSCHTTDIIPINSPQGKEIVAENKKKKAS